MTPEEVEVARQAARELREAIKDAKAAGRELRAVITECGEMLSTQSSELIGVFVEQGLSEYRESLDRAIENATAAVYNRFDTLSAILLGEDHKSRGQGKPTIPELINRLVEQRGRR